MSTTADEVLKEALQLSESERARVATELLASLDPDVETRDEEAWLAEIERRERSGSVWTPDRFEGRRQVALAQRFLEKPQDRYDPLCVHFPASSPPQAACVPEVLGPAGQDLGDDQVFGIDRRYAQSPDVQ
jgi:hypothetical protein